MLAVVPLVLGRSDQGSLLLVQRRLAVALVSASVVIAAELTQTVAQGALLPAWLLALSQSPRWRRYRCFSRPCGRFESPAASRLPSRCEECSRHRCWWESAFAAVAAMALGSAVIEGSVAEGLSRGAIEALAIAGCFVSLARRLGLRR